MNKIPNETEERTYEFTEKDLQRIYWHAHRLAIGDGASVDGVDILNVIIERLSAAETARLRDSTFEEVFNKTLYEHEELARAQRKELLIREIQRQMQ